MKNKKFKAESKQLLELMIHSIYSSKDIFLRELISNSSDALDKRHFVSLTDKANEYDKLEIRLDVNSDLRTITISDNGIGMSESELESNLGTIASSGTKQFMEQLAEGKEDIETIGQFGVGFYAAYIVADKVVVDTKKAGEDAKIWASDGVESYSISNSDREDVGSTITLHVRSDKEFDQFVESSTIKSLVKKYSNYIKYPIIMEELVSKPGENEDDPSIEVLEEVTINSQKALWKRKKSQIKADEYNEFYKTNYFDWQDPLFTFHVQVEGKQNFEFLGFVPGHNNNIFETIEKSKGIDLYCKGVLIDKDVDYLINPAFNFVKGLVDSSDLNLNISREMLQRDEVVNKLTKALNSRIKKELEKKMNKKREEYNTFYEIYGNALAFGVYNNYGADKELFQDLIQFPLNQTGEMTSLKEYLARNSGAEAIYYATGDSADNLMSNPLIKQVTEKGHDVLFLTGDIDEFAVKILDTYNEVPFKTYDEIDLQTAEEKEKNQTLAKDNEQLFSKMSEYVTTLSKVELNSNLENDACRIKAAGPISLEMEKVLAKNPDANQMPNEKILELNPSHPLFAKLQTMDDEQLKSVTQLLFNQQLVKEGLEVVDVNNFVDTITQLIIK